MSDPRWPIDYPDELRSWAEALVDDLKRWVRSFEDRPRLDGADRVLRAVYVWCAMAAAYTDALWSEPDPENPTGPVPQC